MIVQDGRAGTTDIGGQVILQCGGCSVHYRMFSSIPALYALDCSSILPPPLVTTKSIFQTLSCVSWGQNHLWLGISKVEKSMSKLRGGMGNTQKTRLKFL